MSRKTVKAYKKVLEIFIDHLAGDFKPQALMSDFESAIRKAAKQVYRGIDTSGCYFHFSQVFTRFYMFCNIIKYFLLQVC